MSLTLNKVLITEAVDPSCNKLLSDNGVSITTKVGLSADELKAEIKDYDGLIVRSATKVNAGLIAAGTNLKIIGRAGVGVDNIDVSAATKQGVLVINAPGGNTLSAAELTCVMITSLSRNLVEASMSLKAGNWDRKKFMSNELSGKTLAIIGLGRIGREVAHRMQAFGMTTIGYDPLVPAEESIKFGVRSLPLEEIWPLAHYITVHTPLIPKTRNMIDKKVLEICPKGVKIINCARGGIVNEDDLYEALESGQCGGAGLDVYLEEPPKNTKLIQHPKTICTPHLGASTHEAQSRVAVEIAEQFVSLKQGKSAHGIVNSPAYNLSLDQRSQDLLTLCKSLGAIGAVLLPTNETSHYTVELFIKSAEPQGKDALFSTGVLIGLLKQRNVEANLVNAPAVAASLGIKVSKVFYKEPSGDDKLHVEIFLNDDSSKVRSLEGALCEDGSPVLVAIDQQPLPGNSVINESSYTQF